jgi:hypothetical protein
MMRVSVRTIAVTAAFGVLAALPVPALAANQFTCVQNLTSRHTYCSTRRKNGHVAQAAWVAAAVAHFAIPNNRRVNTYDLTQCARPAVTCWEP